MEYTKNLNLFKYDTATDGKEVFSIDKALNANWDIIDQGSFSLSSETSSVGAYIDTYNITAPTIGTKGTTRDTSNFSCIVFRDSEGTRIGTVEAELRPDGGTQTNLTTDKDTDKTYGRLGIRWNATLSQLETEAPACDAAQSIVTTVAISKTTPGYVKFGNGIILQWGTVSNMSYITSTSTYVSFPTSFTYTPFVFLQQDANVGNCSLLVGWQTQSSFTCGIIGATSTYTGQARWFAIGY